MIKAPKITIFTGHFGSGKTEISINYSILCKQNNENVAIVDLDIVNPFNRISNHQKYLSQLGIESVLPIFADKNSDLPAISPNIMKYITVFNGHSIIDLGGNEEGAKVLGVYNEYLKESEFNCVINLNRPETSNLTQLIDLFDKIEFKSRLNITGLINNTNLQSFTSISDLEKSWSIIKKLSEIKNIPIKYFCSNVDYSKYEKQFGVNFLKINRYNMQLWDQ